MMKEIRRHRPVRTGVRAFQTNECSTDAAFGGLVPPYPPAAPNENKKAPKVALVSIVFAPFFRPFFPIFFLTYPSSHLGAPVVPLWILWAFSDDFGLPFWRPFLVIDLFSASFFQASILDRFSMGFASIFTCLEPRFLLENKQFRDFSSFLKKHEKSMISVTFLASFSHPFGILFTSFSVPILV